MKRSLNILFLVFSLVFISCRESFIDVPLPPGGGQLDELYYTDTYSYGKADIYKVNEDGSGRIKLVSGAYLYGQPYNGKYSFTIFKYPPLSNLMIGYTDSTPPVKILSSRDVGFNALLPDGKNILYIEGRSDDHHGKLHIVDVRTGADKKIADDILSDIAPAFSPDGSKIAFFSDKEDYNGHGDNKLIVVSITGGKVFVVSDKLDEFSHDQRLSWTSDNKVLLIKDTYNSENQIFLAQTDGTGSLQQITSDNMMKSDAVISPSGDKIIYLGATETSFDLFVIPITGGTPERLTSTPDVYESYPAFSKDGNKIVFSARQIHFPPDSTQFTNDIRVMDLATKQTTTIANGCFRAFWKK